MRSRLLATALAAAALAAMLTVARVARADEQSEVEKGRAAYFAKSYDDADQRFRVMLDPKNPTLHDPVFIAEARMYWGATMLAKGAQNDASSIFERLILDKPDYEPDAFSLPPSVVNLFIDVRAKLREKLREQREKEEQARLERERHDREEKEREKRRLALLQKMATEQLVVEHHSRLLAFMPFGAGQFQNGSDGLGWTLFTSESAFLATSVVAFPFYRLEVANSIDEYSTFGESHRSQFEQYRSRANTWRGVNLIASGAFALTAIAGIVQAQLAFVPENVEVKKRPIPDVAWFPVLAPLVAPPESGATVNGGFVGLAGRF